MKLRLILLITFIGTIVLAVTTNAASSNANIGGTVVSATEVSIIAAAELLQSASVGVLSLSIPGAGGLLSSEGEDGAMTLRSTGVVGNSIIFSISDSFPLSSLVLALADSGGSFGMNAILSTGQGVNLFINHAEVDEHGKGKVYAIVAYN